MVRGWSFHSVKGGVGKSTLATLTAVHLAAKAPTVLIDMDLTGTSLADVLHLCAPRWSDGGPIDLRRLEETPPDGGFLHRAATEARILARHAAFDGAPEELPTDRHVPFLNDFLLHVPSERSAPKEVRVDALLWELPGVEGLRVIPSSALPGDLERIVPVIFDEQHAAFLEARLEVLLDALLAHYNGCEELHVVVDVPPTIPGLSRSVMSLGLRMSSDPKQELSEDGGTPARLAAAEVGWRIHLVATPDLQDVAATLRWARGLSVEDRAHVRLVVNRVRSQASRESTEHRLRESLGMRGAASDPSGAPAATLESILAPPDPLLDRLTYVEEDDARRLFERAPEVADLRTSPLTFLDTP